MSPTVLSTVLLRSRTVPRTCIFLGSSPHFSQTLVKHVGRRCRNSEFSLQSQIRKIEITPSKLPERIILVRNWLVSNDISWSPFRKPRTRNCSTTAQRYCTEEGLSSLHRLNKWIWRTSTFKVWPNKTPLMFFGQHRLAGKQIIVWRGNQSLFRMWEMHYK